MTDLRLYRRPVSTWWWTRKRSYFVFVMRELSSIFVAWFVAYLVLFVYIVAQYVGLAVVSGFVFWLVTR